MILPVSYWYFKSAIPISVCNQILEFGIEELHKQRSMFGEKSTEAITGDWKHRQGASDELLVPLDGTVQDSVARGVDLKQIYVRDSNVTFLNESWLYEIIHPFVRGANEGAGWNWDWDFTETLQFTRYGPNQFYGWHADSLGGAYRAYNPETDELRKDENGKLLYSTEGVVMPVDQHATLNEKMVGKIRKLSVTIQLNDPSEYDGGNLQFDLGPHREDRYYTCDEIRTQGSVIVFPSHVFHQVTPVTRGVRYSLVAWNLGAPFK